MSTTEEQEPLVADNTQRKPYSFYPEDVGKIREREYPLLKG